MFIPHQFRRAVEQVVEGMKSRILTFGGFNVGSATGAGTGDAAYSGDLQPYRNSTLYTGYVYVPLATPLTSASWDGDSFSTTAKTLIDLSAVFGAPAGIKAVQLYVRVRDSASAGTFCTLILAPHNTADIGYEVSPYGRANDTYENQMMPVPCDANGDIYYQIYASGASTFDVILQIVGYWI